MRAVRDDVVEIAWVFRHLKARWEGHKVARHIRELREAEAMMSFNGAHALHERPRVVAAR